MLHSYWEVCSDLRNKYPGQQLRNFVQATVKFNPWFPTQTTTDVEKWKHIGVTRKTAREKGERSPCQLFCNLDGSNLLLGSPPGELWNGRPSGSQQKAAAPTFKESDLDKLSPFKYSKFISMFKEYSFSSIWLRNSVYAASLSKTA